MPQEEAETFQHYRVLRRDDGSLWKLGAGAMGVTYKAIDTNLDAPVALKVINALYTGNDAARERFIREAKAAASLRHRNVASIHHLGRDAQSYFYAMEFIDGETVEHFVKREGPQSWRIALPAILQVTRALMAAHEKRLVHRDIKPANVMLVREVGEDDLVVKLIDFGLAKSLAEKDGSVINVSGSGFLGTPLYASPEQCDEIAPDIRADIYSLGATLWFVLAGRPPFEGGLGKVFSQHLHAPPPWVQLPAAVPEPVRALLARMLAKDRAYRPQTPADLRREIEACLRACGQSAPEAARPPVAETVAAPTTDPLVAETTLDAPPDAGPVAETMLETPAPAPPTSPATLAAEPPDAGFSLEDALRRNDGRLPTTLVADLLGPLAHIVDAAGTAALDLTPGGVRVVNGNAGYNPPYGVPFEDVWLTGGKPGWLEVFPRRAIHFPTPSGNETMPPDRTGFTTPAAALAALAYELLDGTVPTPKRGYRPLSECDEESNALLRRALEGGRGAFVDASTFAAVLGPALWRQPAKVAAVPTPQLADPAAPPPKKRGRSVNLVVTLVVTLMVVIVVRKLAFSPVAVPGPSPHATVPTSQSTAPASDSPPPAATGAFDVSTLTKQTGTPNPGPTGLAEDDAKAMLHPPVPNSWLLEHHLDIHAQNILDQDTDGDGFTTLDEWNGKSDPQDPKSHPPYYSKLVLTRFVRIPFRLMYETGTLLFQVNTLDLERPTQFLKVGDEVGGTNFRITKFEPKRATVDGINKDVSELTLTNTVNGEQIVLPKNTVVDAPTIYAVLTYLWTGKPFAVKKNQEFTLKPEDNVKYKCLELEPVINFEV